MNKRIALSCGVAALLLTGCYNKPETSLKKPGEAQEVHAPSVGPGTTAGGSTAGPQPVKADHSGHDAKSAEPAKAEAHGADHAPAAKH